MSRDAHTDVKALWAAESPGVREELRSKDSKTKDAISAEDDDDRGNPDHRVRWALKIPAVKSCPLAFAIGVLVGIILMV